MFAFVQVKIWFQNRRARERRGKDTAVHAVMSATTQPLTVATAAGGGGGGANGSAVGVEDHRRHRRRQLTASVSGLMSADLDEADGCCGAVSPAPFGLDDGGGGGGTAPVLTPEHVLRQPFSPPEVFIAAEYRRYAAPPSTSSVAAAMMRATLDYCRPAGSWASVMGFPRHNLRHPVTSPSMTSLPLPTVAAAADLLAQLSSNFNVRQPITSAFSAPPVNLLRF